MAYILLTMKRIGSYQSIGCSCQSTTIRCMQSFSLSKIKIYNPFNVKKYNKDLIYEDNYVKKSRKTFIRSTIDSMTGKKAIEIEKDDILLLEKLVNLPKSLSSLKIDTDHPIHFVADTVRQCIKYNVDAGSHFDFIRVKATIEAIITILEAKFNEYKLDIMNYYYDENWNIITNDNQNNDKIYKQQTAIRVLNCELYLKNLLKLLTSGDLSFSKIDENNLFRICDAFLLGNACDRIVEHLHLYSSEYNQWQLQDSFYQIFEQEVSSVANAFLLVRGLRKIHFKTIPKYSSSYLLDVLDLNQKTRCVFAWSDPNFTSIKPLPEDHKISIDNVLISRRLYFNNSLDIGTTFATDYLKAKKDIYADKKDTKDTLKNGFYFFIITCFLDWGVCVL